MKFKLKNISPNTDFQLMKKIQKNWLARISDFLLNVFRGPEKVTQKLMDYRLDSAQPNETIKGRADIWNLIRSISNRETPITFDKDKFKRKQNLFC